MLLAKKAIYLIVITVFFSLNALGKSMNKIEFYYASFDIQYLIPITKETIAEKGCYFTIDNFNLGDYIEENINNLEYNPSDIRLKIIDDDNVYHVNVDGLVSLDNEYKVFTKDKFNKDFENEIKNAVCPKD